MAEGWEDYLLSNGWIKVDEGHFRYLGTISCRHGIYEIDYITEFGNKEGLTILPIEVAEGYIREHNKGSCYGDNFVSDLDLQIFPSLTSNVAFAFYLSSQKHHHIMFNSGRLGCTGNVTQVVKNIPKIIEMIKVPYMHYTFNIVELVMMYDMATNDDDKRLIQQALDCNFNVF